MIESVETSAETWNDALGGCGAPRLRIEVNDATPPKVLRDGLSVLVMRGAQWCPDSRRDPDDCHDSDRAGLTHLYPSEPDGPLAELREADIEINAVHFRWSRNGEEPGTRSLGAIVAHEIGHVLGLDHPCGSVPGVRGSRGENRPRCTPEFRNELMYPIPVEPGREPVLAPTRGEVEAICAIYRTPVPPIVTRTAQDSGQ